MGSTIKEETKTQRTENIFTAISVPRQRKMIQQSLSRDGGGRSKNDQRELYNVLRTMGLADDTERSFREKQGFIPKQARYKESQTRGVENTVEQKPPAERLEWRPSLNEVWARLGEMKHKAPGLDEINKAILTDAGTEMCGDICTSNHNMWDQPPTPTFGDSEPPSVLRMSWEKPSHRWWPGQQVGWRRRVCQCRSLAHWRPRVVGSRPWITHKHARVSFFSRIISTLKLAISSLVQRNNWRSSCVEPVVSKATKLGLDVVTKGRLIMASVLSIITFACESRPCTRDDLQKIVFYWNKLK